MAQVMEMSQRVLVEVTMALAWVMGLGMPLGCTQEELAQQVSKAVQMGCIQLEYQREVWQQVMGWQQQGCSHSHSHIRTLLEKRSHQPVAGVWQMCLVQQDASCSVFGRQQGLSDQ